MRRRRVEPAEAHDYARRVQEGDCFVCALVRGDGAAHELVFEDDTTIAFLNRYPTQLGHVLVAPKAHVEDVTAGFAPADYLALQGVVHRVGEAVRRVVPTERLYVLSLGSQQGNRHVHWHVVPLPPGVRYEDQQLAALDWERVGVLELTAAELVELGGRIRAEVA